MPLPSPTNPSHVIQPQQPPQSTPGLAAPPRKIDRPATDDDLIIRSYRRVSDETYQRLHDAIVTGYFEPGMRLVERELTARLQVSRTPIREALQRLEKERLIVAYPHRGYYVRSPTLEEARQAYEMRGVIEAACGELAAQRATADEIAAMQRAVNRGEELLNTQELSSLLLANNEFHYLQALASHNDFLADQWRVVWAYVDLLRGRWWMQTDRPSTGHTEHLEMVDAIRRRDRSLAKQLNERHVERAWRAVEARFTREDPPAENPA